MFAHHRRPASHSSQPSRDRSGAPALHHRGPNRQPGCKPIRSHPEHGCKCVQFSVASPTIQWTSPFYFSPRFAPFALTFPHPNKGLVRISAQFSAVSVLKLHTPLNIPVFFALSRASHNRYNSNGSATSKQCQNGIQDQYADSHCWLYLRNRVGGGRRSAAAGHRGGQEPLPPRRARRSRLCSP